jgi:hypothetical protein
MIARKDGLTTDPFGGRTDSYLVSSLSRHVTVVIERKISNASGRLIDFLNGAKTLIVSLRPRRIGHRFAQSSAAGLRESVSFAAPAEASS